MFCAYQDGKLIHFTLLDASGKPVGIQPVWARWNYEVANVLGECSFRSLCSTIPQVHLQLGMLPSTQAILGYRTARLLHFKPPLELKYAYRLNHCLICVQSC